MWWLGRHFKRTFFFFSFQKMKHKPSYLCSIIEWCMRLWSRRNNICLGCSSLLVSAIDLSPHSSLWRRSVSPSTDQTDRLCLQIRLITCFLFLLRTEESVWMWNTEGRHGAQQYLPLFSWPKQEPVTQIDFVLLWGCVISRGKIMSIVSLMDRECIMGHTFQMNYA